ncbi:hypothetical protein LCGC14_1572160, partial [marine sediment metagenome]
ISFYMPPTGVTVERAGKGEWVRSAVTLERLQYCVLIDESGEKRYPQGPSVVFPAPTEKFVLIGGEVKQDAVQLNELQGCLFKVIDIDNILFASEMFGAVKGVDPETGHNFDDTKRYIDALDLSEGDRAKVFEGNARRVYPRLDSTLRARGL